MMSMADVVVNISGQRFNVSVNSLNAEAQSILACMIRENFQASNRQEIFLWRDPSVFQYVLNYLRLGTRASLPNVNETDTLQRLLKEAELYQLHGLVPLIWRVIHNIPPVLPPLQVNDDICWNPGTISLYWQSVAVMTHTDRLRRCRYEIAGFIKQTYQIKRDSTWWCYDVRCPACSSFDFAPVNGKVELGAVERSTKSIMETSRGKVRKICGAICALVDFDQGWRFHIPLSALLPYSKAN